MSTTRSPLTAAPCRALGTLRHRYSAADTTAKLALLRAIARQGVRLRSFAALDALHSDLLFLCAFPDSAAVHAAARAALARIEPALRALSPAQRARADDTGIAGSATIYPPPYEIARWITTHWPRAADVHWESVEDSARIDTLIRPLLQRAEEDGFEGGDFTTQQWLDDARDARRESALCWLLASADRAGLAPGVFRAMYDAVEPPVRWSLARSPASVTHNRLRVATIVPRAVMRRADADSARAIAAPLADIQLVDPVRGTEIIDVARAALAARGREVYAFSHANPEEVWWAPLGEGVALAVVGVVPADRLSLESNYGYLLLSNGVPVGYGGVTPLFHQANTGINIFAPFRGSEGAYLWQQMLRTFHTLFGVTRFVVDAVQFGEDNDEAIASGAYWFYWRMGFRPPGAALRARAEREAARLARSRTATSSASTLRALAHGTMQLVLPGGEAHAFLDESWLSRCAKGAAELLERTAPHDHRAAAATMATQLAQTLGVSARRWRDEFTAPEREAFTRLAPVVQLCGGAETLTSAERVALVQLLRAKGHATEQAYVRLAQAHPALFARVYGYCERRRS